MTTRFAPALLALLLAGCPAATTPAPAGSPSPASATPGATATATPAASATAKPGATATPAAAGTAKPAATDAEACEHIGKTPGVEAKANLVSMSRERAKVAADHKRYDVTLVPNNGQNEGYVLMDAEGGHHAFSLGKDVPFKLKQDGKDVAFESQAKASATCPAIKASYAADLKAGQVELHFGPTAETSVPLVVEHGEHGH